MKIKNIRAGVHRLPIFLALSDAGGGTLFSMHQVAAFRNATHIECHAKSRYMLKETLVKA